AERREKKRLEEKQPELCLCLAHVRVGVGSQPERTRCGGRDGRPSMRLQGSLRVLVPSVLLGAHLPAFADDAIFGFEDIAERARVLAAAPYQPPGNALPKELKQLSYHQYKDIRFNPQAAYWRD